MCHLKNRNLPSGLPTSWCQACRSYFHNLSPGASQRSTSGSQQSPGLSRRISHCPHLVQMFLKSYFSLTHRLLNPTAPNIGGLRKTRSSPFLTSSDSLTGVHFRSPTTSLISPIFPEHPRQNFRLCLLLPSHGSRIIFRQMIPGWGKFEP